MKRCEIVAVICLAATWSVAGTMDWDLLPIDGGGYVMNVAFTRNPQVAYMTIDVGGPYRSDDGLKTWRPLHGAMPYDMKRNCFSSPRSLSVNPRDENDIVVAAGNNARHPAGIIVSRDYGMSFSVLPGGFDHLCGHDPALFVDRGRIWVIGGGSGCWTRSLNAAVSSRRALP